MPTNQKPMKYFVFPQEIIFMNLKNFELKIVDESKIMLKEATSD